jgi:O-antigen/teichoic acid export membrane protein
LIQSFFRKSVVYGIGSIANSLIAFVLIPLYARYLAPESYGALALCELLIQVLILLCVVGQDYALFRNFYKTAAEEPPHQVLPTVMAFYSGVAGVFTVAMVALSDSLGPRLIRDPAAGSLFRDVALISFLEGYVLILLGHYRVQEKALAFVTVSLAKFLLSLIATIVFVVGLKRGVVGALEGRLLAVSFIAPVLLWRERRKLAWQWLAPRRLKALLSFGLPFVPVGLANLVLTLSDRYFLQAYSTMAEVGLYSMAYRIAMSLNVVLIRPLETVWGPFRFKVAEHSDANRIYSRLLTYFCLIGVGLGLPMAILSKEILELLSTAKYLIAAPVIPWVVLSYLAYGMASLLNVGIVLRDKTKWLAPITCLSAGLNLLLNWLLIPGHGMMGAAWATLASYGVMALLTATVSLKLLWVDYEYGRLALIFALGALLYGLGVQIDGQLGTRIVLKLGVAFVYPLGLLGLGFFSPGERVRMARLLQGARASPEKRASSSPETSSTGSARPSS